MRPIAELVKAINQSGFRIVLRDKNPFLVRSGKMAYLPSALMSELRSRRTEVIRYLSAEIVRDCDACKGLVSLGNGVEPRDVGRLCIIRECPFKRVF